MDSILLARPINDWKLNSISVVSKSSLGSPSPSPSGSLPSSEISLTSEPSGLIPSTVAVFINGPVSPLQFRTLISNKTEPFSPAAMLSVPTNRSRSLNPLKFGFTIKSLDVKLVT